MIITDKKEIDKLSCGSKKRIDIQCDYCKEYFNREYRKHIAFKYHKDYCRKCIKIKNTEEFLIKLNCSEVDDVIKYMLDSGNDKLNGIYSIRNKENNKSYIGSSKDIVYRFKCHIDSITKGEHYCNEFNFIDVNNLEFIILKYPVEHSKLVDLEYKYINLFRTNNVKYGYNIMSKRKNSYIYSMMNTKIITNRIHSSTLSLSEVKNIKIDLCNGLYMKDLALKYNINYNTIQDIKSCDIWSNVLPELNDKLKSIKYVGRQKGELNGCSKLTEVQVKEIKDLLVESNFTMTDIGKKYGVSRTLIGHIKRGKLWSHIV